MLLSIKVSAALQTRSALFGDGGAERTISLGWLVFGTYVLAGLVFGALCAVLAVSRAKPPLLWFFAGLVGNVIALVILLMSPRGDSSALPAGIPDGMGKVPLTRRPVPCPECGETNHPSATACAGCGATLLPTVESETARA